MTPAAVTVMCVDDNDQVRNALRLHMNRTGRFECVVHFDRADGLVREAMAHRPMIVILDIDMPGRDPFDALAELSRRCPEIRTIIFSGHTRLDLVERAVEAGAWGYVSKNDGEGHLVHAIERVVAGEFALSPEPQAIFSGGAFGTAG